jgi:hypothetical protein
MEYNFQENVGTREASQIQEIYMDHHIITAPLVGYALNKM